MWDMNQEVCTKIIHTIGLSSEYVFYYWDVVNNTWSVEGDNLDGLSLKSEHYNPLEVLLATSQLTTDSRFVFNRFYQRILTGIMKSITVDKMSVTFHLVQDEKTGKEGIVNFHAFFTKGSDGRIKEISGFARQYTEQEIMDNAVLSTFTVDKGPSIFYDRVDALLHNNPESKFAFVQFDIDGFKMINDRYGDYTGDKLLKFISSMLEVMCNEHFSFARITEDIYIVAMMYEDPTEIFDFINVLDANLRWYEGIEYKFVYGVRMIEHYDRNLMNVRNLIDEAGIARRSIKGNELKHVAVFEETQKHDIEYKKNLTSRLRHAIEGNEFLLYLQPKYDIETENLIGAESLVRWNHPEAGVVSPQMFIGILEANGLILNVDQFVWEETCRNLRRWIDARKHVVPISVNVSRTYIESANVVEYFKMLVEKYDLPPTLLEIEITETVENSDIAEVIQEFKNVGFTVLMDDFGSGFSSLNMLKSTNFDILKLDREFLSEFLENDRGKKIISHTIAMSRDMGIDMVAEGVETKEQADFLRACGCKTAQGYYYSEPMTLEQFEQLL